MTNTKNKPIGTRRKSLTTILAALLAGSLAATAGGFAYAKTDGQASDPAKFQQRIEKRVDKALTGTDATADQKKQVAGILQGAFKDMKPLHDQRVENRKAMEAALQAPTIDPARIEQIRAEQMKVADASSKRFTKALEDAGNVLSASQRQAFFKNWSERHGERRHG
jgi:Spy/CpxP family protein refolding chaperone